MSGTVDLVEEWRETDRARRKTENMFTNLLNRSTQSLTRSKSQDGKARRSDGQDKKDLKSKAVDPPRAPHAAASRLPVSLNSPEKHGQNYASADRLYTHRASSSLPQDPFARSPPSYSPRNKPRPITTNTSHLSSNVGSSSSYNNARSPSSANTASSSRRASSPFSPTMRKDSTFSTAPPSASSASSPPSASSSVSAGRRMFGILNMTTTGNQKASPSDSQDQKRYHSSRSGSGSSHEPLISTQTNMSERPPSRSAISATGSPRTFAGDLRSITPGFASSADPDSQRTGTYTKLKLEPRKSSSRLDFWRSPRSTPKPLEDKGKRRLVTPEPIPEVPSTRSSVLHSPQPKAPVSFLDVPKLQRTPPTPQKDERRKEQPSTRVESFLSDSLPIMPPMDTARLTPPVGDNAAVARHPAFVDPSTVIGIPQAVSIQRSKSAPTSRGRTSPCLRIPSPKFFSKDKDKESKKERKVTPESVGSPIIREKKKLPKERPSQPHQHRIHRTTHGSFDFERPGSRNSSKSGHSDPRSDDENDRQKVMANARAAVSKAQQESSEPASHNPKYKASSPIPPLPSPPLTSRLPPRRSPPPRTRSPLGRNTATSSHDDDDSSTLPRLSSSMGRSSRTQRMYAAHPSFSFEPATSLSGRGNRDTVRTGTNSNSVSVRHSGRIVDTFTGLMWAPARPQDKAIAENVARHARSRSPQGKNMKDFETESVEEATEVLAAMRSVLNDAGFLTLQKYVRRFDDKIIPADGPAGLIIRVQRLLDTCAPRIDESVKRQLVDRFANVVRDSG